MNFFFSFSEGISGGHPLPFTKALFDLVAFLYGEHFKQLQLLILQRIKTEMMGAFGRNP